MHLALLLGALLAVATLAYVMYPLVRSLKRSGAGGGVDSAGVAPGQRSRLTISDDEIEAAVRAYRESHPGIAAGAPITPASGAACPTCGPRPERDASYCSSCGRPLAAAGARG
jgi:hypothetical protein